MISLARLPSFLALVLAVSVPLPLTAQEFLWRTEGMRAEIRVDDGPLHLGKYLHLSQSLRPNETGWTMMKIDLPDQWEVKVVSVASGRVKLLNSDETAYELTRDNVGQLDFAILNGGKKTNEQLKELWDKYARVKG